MSAMVVFKGAGVKEVADVGWLAGWLVYALTPFQRI